jgi:hypothetical protein
MGRGRWPFDQRTTLTSVTKKVELGKDNFRTSARIALMGAKLVLGAVVFGVIGAIAACGGSDKGSGFQPNGGDGGDDGDGSVLGGDGGILGGGDGGTVGEGGVIVGDPKDCADAKTSKSYVGCDYYPTVTANAVWSIFDYAVVVSNVGTAPATVTVTGGALTTTMPPVTVAPGALQKIYLPWVPALKGPDTDNCGDVTSLANSILAPGGAYHLVSTTPVVVYQFNALEYGPTGGPAGKNWSSCPGSTECTSGPNAGAPIGCESYTNDASLLLPSTAMTLNYRVSGHPAIPGASTYFTVTATVDGTNVTATLSSAGQVLATSGAGIAATAGGGTLKFTLAHAGDVAEIVGPAGDTADFSGSLVQADQPIEVLAGTSAVTLPETSEFSPDYTADHTEQTVLPVETLGKHYVVSMPDKPGGGNGQAVVGFYGNEDSTTLTYNPATPPKGCPTTLNAGQVVYCNMTVGTFTTTIGSASFEVTGDKEYGLATFQPSSEVYGSNPGGDGDPSESVMAAVEQFRLKYLFLAPTDYDESYAEIVGTSDAAPVLDGTAVASAFTAIGTGPYGLWRVTLNGGPKSDGAHTLTSTQPVGLQVVGYGKDTSYQYPGGLNLNQIAPSPPPPR